MPAQALRVIEQAIENLKTRNRAGFDDVYEQVP